MGRRAVEVEEKTLEGAQPQRLAHLGAAARRRRIREGADDPINKLRRLIVPIASS